MSTILKLIIQPLLRCRCGAEDYVLDKNGNMVCDTCGTA